MTPYHTPPDQAGRPVRADLFGRTFDKPGTFQAMYAAEDFLRILGFSVGSNQKGSPRGVLFGKYVIAKWRNLRPAEREALHGQMTGNMLNGPVVLRFSDNLPAEAVAALREAVPTSPDPLAETTEGARHGPCASTLPPAPVGAGRAS